MTREPAPHCRSRLTPLTKFVFFFSVSFNLARGFSRRELGTIGKFEAKDVPVTVTTILPRLEVSRKEVLSFGACSLLSVRLAVRANAFDNKISAKYDDKPKRRGPQPKDLGISRRTNLAGDEYVGLKNCGLAPNCFCSTDDNEDDPEHSIPAWTWPKELGDDMEKAFVQLEEAIASYKPGQGNIDGGGFKVITSNKSNGYLYVQFESLKAGYIDDVELAYVRDKGKHSFQVRSSSRVGYLDFGANAKRINFIAKIMQGMGWDAPGVDFLTHQDYAIQNSLT